MERIAMTVVTVGRRAVLSPFFAYCGAVTVLDSAGVATHWLANTERTTEAVCELILQTAAVRVICGFVPGEGLDRLRRTGLDVRVGPCASAVEVLVREFEKLPRA